MWLDEISTLLNSWFFKPSLHFPYRLVLIRHIKRWGEDTCSSRKAWWPKNQRGQQTEMKWKETSPKSRVNESCIAFTMHIMIGQCLEYRQQTKLSLLLGVCLSIREKTKKMHVKRRVIWYFKLTTVIFSQCNLIHKPKGGYNHDIFEAFVPTIADHGFLHKFIFHFKICNGNFLSFWTFPAHYLFYCSLS